VIILVAIAAFFVVESTASEPILPLHVFKVRNFSLASGMSFLLGLAMLGAMTFLPLYQQTVQHASPTTSGLLLIPMMLGATSTSLLSGWVTSKTGRYKILPIVGGVVMTLGLFLLSFLGTDTSRLTSALFFVVLGIGMGFLMQITSLIVQNSVTLSDIGVASSSRAFFQQIGGSIGVSLFGAIFVRELNTAMSAKLPGVHLASSGGQFNPQTIDTLKPIFRDAAFYAISHAEDSVFMWTLPATIAVFILALFIKEIPLRGRAEYAAEQAAAAASPELVH
jgi:MFS family permease